MCALKGGKYILNFVFVSPQFPKTYWNFCDRLKRNGVNVLGIGDSGYDEIPDELKECLTEYYRVHSMADYDAMVRAMGYFTFKYGKIDWLESNNEFWLEQDAALRTDTSDNLYLPISQIEPYANQPRRHFDEEALQDLADSIREHGIIQPLTVRRLSSGYYQIIAGERRWRAARIAGLSEVPAIVIEADDRKMTELSLIENLQREDLDPIEEAEGYKTLMDNYHLTQEEAAERVGKSRSAVANSLRLLGLCPEVRQMLQNGDLSGGHARALLPLKADLQLDAANLIVKQGLSVRQTEALAKRLANPKEERKPTNDELIAESYGRLAAQELSDKIGRTCRIVSGKKKGRIELDYYGIDDLNDLLEALAAIKRRKNGDE